MKLTLSEIYQYLQALVLYPARSSPTQRSTSTCRYLYCTVPARSSPSQRSTSTCRYLYCTVPSKKLTLSEIYQYLQVLVLYCTARSSPSQRSTSTCRYLYCTVPSKKLTLSEIYQYLQVLVLYCTQQEAHSLRDLPVHAGTCTVLYPARSPLSQRFTSTCRYVHCTVPSKKLTLLEIYQYLQVPVLYCTQQEAHSLRDLPVPAGTCTVLYPARSSHS
jgi:hypothetical protein